MTIIKKLTALSTVCSILALSPGFVWAQEGSADVSASADTAAEAATATETTVEPTGDTTTTMIAPSRGSIPEDLLRPRREEAPRYAVDTVIGHLGQGESPAEAYRFARRVATALTAGNINAEALASMNRAVLEIYFESLETVNPKNFRLGGGREEDDGSVSFLVRFIGPEQAITGELYVRDIVQAVKPPPQKPVEVKPTEIIINDEELADEEIFSEEIEGELAVALEEEPEPTPVVQGPPPGLVIWAFEDLILEDAKKKDGTNPEPRFDFSPYQRFF